MKPSKASTNTKPVELEQMDEFVVALITALRDSGDPLAVAEIKKLLITPALEELLRFVGITAKQSGTTALFTWTEAISTGDLDETD